MRPQSRADFGDAYWSLANLKTYRFTPRGARAAAGADERSGGGRRGSGARAVRTGQGAGGRGRLRAVLPLLRAGQRAQARRESLRPADHREQHARADRGVHARVLCRAQRLGAAEPDPILIVGLPRSGSTLLEQILASHSQVEGTQELPNVQQIVATLRGRDPDPSNPRYPRILTELECRGGARARGALPRGSPGVPHGQAVLHRQDAEQLPAPRADSADAAEREDHRRAPRADGLLLQQPEAAVRQRPGVHLQHRGHRALLPHLPGADAPLGPGAARPDPARAARGRGR